VAQKVAAVSISLRKSATSFCLSLTHFLPSFPGSQMAETFCESYISIVPAASARYGRIVTAATRDSFSAMKTTINRRSFLSKSATAGAGLLILRNRRLAFAYEANSKLNIAGIGVGGQGRGSLDAFHNMGNNLVALCDVDARRALQSSGALTHLVTAGPAAETESASPCRPPDAPSVGRPGTRRISPGRSPLPRWDRARRAA
jgi:hypothetical protein